MHPWSIHPQPRPHPYGSSLSPAARPQSQANEPHSVIHVPETHVTLEDASVHLPPQTVPQANLVSNSAQFTSGLHALHDNFEVQYVSSHPPPFQNQPSQQYMYHGYYPIDSNRYPTPQYFPAPLPPRPGPPYPQPNVAGNNLSGHHLTHGLAPPMLPPVASLFRPGLYNMQQYPLPLHNSTGYFGMPVQYQPNEYQNYYELEPARNTLRQGTFTHGQQPLQPRSYPRSRNQHLPRDPNPPRVQPSSLERSPSSSLGHSDVATSSSTNPPVALVHPPEQISAAQSPPNSETWEPREPTNVSAGGSTSRSMAHNRPLARRRDYHPNPPPNRTEWVMWMGNVPNDATHDQLWQFLRRRPDTVAPDSESSGSYTSGFGDSGVLSVFLINRSNCAFVNYQSKQHLNRAISLFNGRQLRPHDRQCPRLVCRARQRDDELRAGVGAQRGTGLHARYVKKMVQKDKETTIGKTTSLPKGRQTDSSTTADTPSVPSAAKEEVTKSQQPKESPSSYASTNSSLLDHYFPKRFFILKSLTQDDLDLSVERGVWATQKHNERILDQAFRTSQDVILIFSVNKSGEFYGHARMASSVLSDNHNVSWARRPASPSSGQAPPLGILGQGAGAMQQSPQMLTTPIKRLSEEAQSPRDSAKSQAKAARDRRSAPAVLHNVGENIFSADSPLRPVTSQVTQHPNSPSTTRSEPGKSSVLWSRMRGRGSGSGCVDNPTLGTTLQPVMEEVHSTSGAEEDTLPAPSLAPPQTGGASEVEQQERKEEVGWGESFKVDWSCTRRVPFYRTRHLRNPWNHGREIKVSRDGTEVEPTVGQQLVDEWSTLASEVDGGEARRGRQPTAKSLGRRGGPEGRPKHVKE